MFGECIIPASIQNNHYIPVFVMNVHAIWIVCRILLFLSHFPNLSRRYLWIAESKFY